MQKTGIVLAVGLLLMAAGSLYAQGGVVTSGCTNSPENPTALLAVVGTAGGFFSYLRARRRSRSK